MARSTGVAVKAAGAEPQSRSPRCSLRNVHGSATRRSCGGWGSQAAAHPRCTGVGCSRTCGHPTARTSSTSQPSPLAARHSSPDALKPSVGQALSTPLQVCVNMQFMLAQINMTFCHGGCAGLRAAQPAACTRVSWVGSCSPLPHRRAFPLQQAGKFGWCPWYPRPGGSQSCHRCSTAVRDCDKRTGWRSAGILVNRCPGQFKSAWQPLRKPGLAHAPLEAACCTGAALTSGASHGKLAVSAARHSEPRGA